VLGLALFTALAGCAAHIQTQEEWTALNDAKWHKQFEADQGKMKYTLEECAPCSREEKAAYFAAKYRSHLSPSEVARIMDSGEREYQQRMAETNRQIDQERSQREQRSATRGYLFRDATGRSQWCMSTQAGIFCQ